MRNFPRGRFVTVDGPSAVGKTTACESVRISLAASGDHDICVTSTPSTSDLGRLIRAGTYRYSGYALSCLVAADRYRHRTAVVEPACAEGRLVLCDRYVPSAYALDRLDGVPIEFIHHLYAALPPPDLAVILLGEPAVCAARAAARGAGYSRFHSTDPAMHAREAALFEDAANALAAQGYPVNVIRIGDHTRSEVTAEVEAALAAMMGDS